MTLTKRMKRKRGLKIVAIILAVILLSIGICSIITITGNIANTKMAKSFEKVTKDDQLTPEKDSEGNWTFTTDREFKIMQLTDIHIGGGFMSLQKDSWALNSVATMIMVEKPDLVIVTGDMVYPVPFQAGTFNNLSSTKIFISLMESLGVYWTIAFGNHDTEMYSYYNREEIAKYYADEDLQYCLFQEGPTNIDGKGNQVINIKNSFGLITQSLILLDSHSYTNNDYFGVRWEYDKIHDNQIEWYENQINFYNNYNNELLETLDTSLLPTDIDNYRTIKSLAFFHIPIEEYLTSWNEYAENDYQDTQDTEYIYGKAGESGKIVYCAVKENNLFEKMLELDSTKGIFCGHDHLNNFSLDYKGIRLTYGMSIDYLAYAKIYKKGEQRGCTMITTDNECNFDYWQENYYQAKYSSQYEKESIIVDWEAQRTN